jgi:predicted nucleic-acid-binding Zn-ribbon protein
MIRENLTMSAASYSCAKCSGTQYQTGEIRTTGSGLSRFLNIQNNKFSTVSCNACGYTEVYRRAGGGFGNVVDFFTN